MFRFAALALTVTSASAFGSFNADVNTVGKIMSKSRSLEERQMNFIAGMYIKYEGCTNTISLGEGGGEEGLMSQGVVTFKLCESCSSCSGGGVYAVDMATFVDAYTEAQMNEQEYKCEMARESCEYKCEQQQNNNNNNNNGNQDGDYCENNCLYQGGMEECIEMEGEEEFEVQRYLECAEMEAGNNNNNNGNYNQNQQNGNNNGNYNGNGNYNWQGQYFIGPYCSSDSKSIKLGVFYDEQCVSQVKNGASIYSQYNYGYSLPYSDESMIPSGACVSCRDMERENENNGQNNYNGQNAYNNGGNNYYQQNYEPNEFCQESYEAAARCEKNMDIAYPDTRGCEYINSYLPQLASASRNFSAAKVGSSAGTGATVMAWVFGITTVLFGSYAYFLYRKIKRGVVGLSKQEGGAIA